jgi:hypothetical protein
MCVNFSSPVPVIPDTLNLYFIIARGQDLRHVQKQQENYSFAYFNLYVARKEARK